MSNDSKTSLIREIEALKQELAKREQALAILIGKVKPSEKSAARRGEILSGTIKADIMALLEGQDEGFTAVDILQHLRVRRPDLMRTSLSPQLSRLKQAGWLIYNDGKWCAKIREEKM